MPARHAFPLVVLLLAACGDDPVAGHRPGDLPGDNEPARPQLAFASPPVRFGPVTPGTAVRAEVVLENVGTAPVTGLAAALRGDAALSFEGMVPYSLAPETSLRLVLVYRPLASGTHTATLVASGDGEVAAALPVVGAAATAEDWFSPSPLDFGEGDPTCGPRERGVTLANPTPFPAVVEALAVDDAGAGRFALAEGPEASLVLEPGIPVALRVSFAGGEAGTYAGTVWVRLQGMDLPLVLPLTARVAPVARVTRIVPATPAPRVAVLVVIDDGPGMAGQLPRIQDHLSDLWMQMNSFSGRIAVTTTSLAGGAGCGGADGRFVPLDGSGRRILFTPSRDQEGTPGGVERLAANADVGTCSPDEARGLEAALRAITEPLATSADDPRHPEPDDGNLGFLLAPDDNWHLELVFISNRVDVSPETSSHYDTSLRAAIGSRNSLGIHAITGDPGTGCAGDDGFTAAPGDRLAGLAHTFASICGDDWFDPWIFPIYECWPVGCIDLPTTPRDLDRDGDLDEADLEVLRDGQPLPAVGADGRTLWSYDPEASAVCFTGHAHANCAVDLAVTYTPACP